MGGAAAMKFDVQVLIGELDGSVPCDALVHPTNTELVFASSMAGVLASAADPALADEAARLGPVALGDVVRTDAHVRGVRHVFHVAVHGYRAEDIAVPLREGTTSSDAIVRTAMERALALAEENRCAVVAIPLLASIVAGFPLGACASVMFDALWDHLAAHPATVIERVVLLALDDDERAVLDAARSGHAEHEKRARESVEQAEAAAVRAKAAAEQEAARRAEREAREHAERAAREAAAREAERLAREDAARAERAREAAQRDAKQAEKIRKMFVATETLKVDQHAVDALRKDYRERAAKKGAEAEPTNEAPAEEELQGFGDEDSESEATEVRPPRR